MRLIVTDAQLWDAVSAACVEAGWDWDARALWGQDESSYEVPSPEQTMRPVILAALATLDIGVEGRPT